MHAVVERHEADLCSRTTLDLQAHVHDHRSNRLKRGAENASLASTAGLGALERVDDNLTIEANPSLSSLEVGSLISVGGDLRLRDNPALPTCTAVALSMQLAFIGGTATIENNLPDACSP